MDDDATDDGDIDDLSINEEPVEPQPIWVGGPVLLRIIVLTWGKIIIIIILMFNFSDCFSYIEMEINLEYGMLIFG